MRLIPEDRHLGWTPYAWLIYSIPFLVRTSETRGDAALFAANVISFIAFLFLYFLGYWFHGRKLVAVIASMTLLAGVSTTFNLYGSSFFIYAAAMLAFINMNKPRLLHVGLYVALVAIYGVVLDHGLWFFVPAVLIAGVIGSVNVHYAQVWNANEQIRMAQGDIERLAKIAERERIARDLHDVLGHTLSVIALKSELASKLIDRDPGRAAQEIREVNDVARDALAQVRSAVTGYRASGLSAEFAAMRKAFDTAGVRLLVEAETLVLPPTHENALALVLREASTNVLRHARATKCRVRLGHRDNLALLEIVDDGRGGDSHEGNGLAGMRERIAALGGSLVRDGRTGMRIEITLPLAPKAA
ncbi:MAG: sensor histidine kinase [Vicinamibacteria bacterium]